MSRLLLATSLKLTRRKGHCSLCGEPVPIGRRSWCSEACVTRWQEATWPAMQRKRLFERDRGVCRLCGFDAGRWTRILMRLHADWCGGHLPRESRLAANEAHKRWWALLKRHGFQPLQSLWEGDHVVPLVEGGDPSVSNMRTLCRPCHKRETAALARRRAVARSKQERLFDEA